MKRLFRTGFIISMACVLLCTAACGGSPDAPTTSGIIDASNGTESQPLTQESSGLAASENDVPANAQTNDPNGSKASSKADPGASAANHPGTSATAKPGTAAPAASSNTSAVVKIIIPEGFTFYQVAQRLEANGICTAAAFYQAAQSYQIQSFSAPVSSESCYRMEGMLYPDTYEFYKGEDPVAVLRKMLNNYAAKSGLPSYETLILASIIERETRSNDHMAMVSSVFHNRLKQGMRLQADATIAYVENHIKPNSLVSNPGQYAERYNTYKCAALPVGPICNPGRRAIQAAMNPSQSDYLYYFFGTDNTNHYSKTYDEHLAAINQYGVG